MTLTNFQNGVTAKNIEVPFIQAPAPWIAGVNPDGAVVFIAEWPCMVAAVTGRLTTAEGTASTVQATKVPDGTAPAGGTALTTAPFNANGTENANQYLTLVDEADLMMDAGDSIILVTSGNFTQNVASIQVSIVPQPAP